MNILLTLWLFISLGGQNAVMGQDQRGIPDHPVFTILYENSSATDSIIADHGFSCLIESGDHSCLFDTGRISEKFFANAGRLSVDFSRIDRVFVSHFHDDHMGALSDVLAKCRKPALFLPFSYPQLIKEPPSDRADADFQALLERWRPFVSGIVRKKEPIQIGDQLYSTGMIEDKTYEQALIVQTPKGLILIVGCAHPGILEMVKRAKEVMKQDVYLVLGGFHLLSTGARQVDTIARELRMLTRHIGPCHCTGENAQKIFEDVFREDYVDVKAGLKLKVGEGPLR